MKVKVFNFWKSTRELEVNFISRKWNLRLGTHQMALWNNCTPVFSFARPRTGG